MINLFADLAVWGCVGHKNILNFCCSDIFEKCGTSDDISSNAIVRSVSNLVHCITKCCSSSTGPSGGGDVLVGGGEQGVLVLGGEQ